MPTETRNTNRSRNYNYNSVYGRDRRYNSQNANTAYDIPTYYPKTQSQRVRTGSTPSRSGRVNYGGTYGARNTNTRNTRSAVSNRAVIQAANTAVKTEAKQKNSVRYGKRSMRRIATISFIAFVAAAVILCRYVSISNSNRMITELEKEYSQLVSSNQAMQVKINGQIEKGEIEKKAKEELGMMEPESYQMFYIDMDMPDSGIKGDSTGKSDKEVLGTAGTLINAFRTLK